MYWCILVPLVHFINQGGYWIFWMQMSHTSGSVSESETCQVVAPAFCVLRHASLACTLSLSCTPTARPGRLAHSKIRDCARGCSNRTQMCPQLSAIDVTAGTFFERLYLVLGLCKVVPWVNCPYALTTLTVHSTTISRFWCTFFARMAPHFFVIMIHQVIFPSPGTSTDRGNWDSLT